MEEAGLSTILVTQMPYWAEKIGVPRTLAVEFPFGHTLGQPDNVEMQMRVIRQALQVLKIAEGPGEIHHSPQSWPEPQRKAIKKWQPSEPSPVIDVMLPRLRQMIRERKGK